MASEGVYHKLELDPVWCPSVATSWCICFPAVLWQHGGSLYSAAAPMGTRCDSSPAAAGVAPSRGSLAAGVLAAPAAAIAYTTSAAAPTAHSAAATVATPISRCANPHTPVVYPTDASQSPSAGPSTEGEGTSSTEGEGTSTTESLPSTCEIGNNPRVGAGVLAAMAAIAAASTSTKAIRPRSKKEHRATIGRHKSKWTAFRIQCDRPRVP